MKNFTETSDFYKAVHVYVWEFQKNNDYSTLIYVANFSSVGTKMVNIKRQSLSFLPLFVLPKQEHFSMWQDGMNYTCTCIILNRNTFLLT